MTTQPNLTKFQQKLAERRAREAAKKEAAEPTFDSDLIPDAAYDRSDADAEMDKIIDGIDIIEAYNRWCGKMRPIQKGDQREGIKISCPIPGHIDNDPSAWINLDKQTWFCGGCQQGGDKYDIAAYRKGFSVPGYKDGADFHRLRESMAADYGFSVSRTPAGHKIIVPPESEPAVEEASEPSREEVVSIFEDDEEDDYADIQLSLDWRPVSPPQTFIDEYMKATIIDDAPEEYHFFHALVALGFALGRDVALADHKPVYGNLFICTLGRSGSGKSRAKSHLDSLLEAALPYDHSAPVSRGVLKVNAPASAESLIYSFQKAEEDPTNPKRIVGYLPVRGLVDFNELSGLIGRTKRLGSVLTPTLLQFYDMDGTIQTHSMTTGNKIAKQPFASCVTTSQPKALRGLLTQDDDRSGFLNRWLFIPGTEKKRIAIGGVQIDMTPAVKPLQDIQGWAATKAGLISLSPAAEALFTDWFDNVFQPLLKSAKNDLYGRLDLTIKKLMLLFAANRMEDEISEQSVFDALHLFPYIKAAYGIPAGEIGNTVANEISEAILKQIENYTAKGGITRAKLWDNIKHKKFDKGMVVKQLEHLDRLGLIDEIQVNAGKVGRPTVKYRLSS